MKPKKKLIEVALPLDAINKASAREKRNPFLKGHPRNLHQWWARRPLAAERAVPPSPEGGRGEFGEPAPRSSAGLPRREGIPAPRPCRFHGSVELDSTRGGRDASRIAEEVLSHLSGQVGAKVRVTLEVEAEIPGGAPENVVRIVTENSRTLKFSSHGFEKD